MSRIAVPTKRRSRSRREAGTHARAGGQPTTPTPAPAPNRDPAARMRRARRLGHTVQGIAAPSAAPGCGTVQRALPPGEADTKGFYEASVDAQWERYSGRGRPCQFTGDFRKQLLKYWRDEHRTVSEDLQNVQVHGKTHRYWVPTTAFQIDHNQPWTTIAKEIYKTAKGLSRKATTPSEFLGKAFRPYEKRGRKRRLLDWDWLQDKEMNVEMDGVAPTKWGARMYYHDVDNLVPMAGSENASKSNRSVGEISGRELIEQSDTHVRALGGELAALSWEIGRKFDLISANYSKVAGDYPDLIEELDYFLGEMAGFNDYLEPLYQAAISDTEPVPKSRKRKLSSSESGEDKKRRVE